MLANDAYEIDANKNQANLLKTTKTTELCSSISCETSSSSLSSRELSIKSSTDSTSSFKNDIIKQQKISLKQKLASSSLSSSNSTSAIGTTISSITNKSLNSSLSSSNTSLNNLKINQTSTHTNKNDKKTQNKLSCPYHNKKFYGKEWLFKKLFDYIVNKTYEKPFLLMLIGDAGNGKTHFCCELKWPTINLNNNIVQTLNKHLISIYFINLYNCNTTNTNEKTKVKNDEIDYNSDFKLKQLINLYNHLKNSILSEISSFLNVNINVEDEINQVHDVENELNDDNYECGEVKEDDETCGDDDDEYLINKYVKKFNENVINVLNKYNEDICKLNKNFFLLIDGIDELLLYDQYLTTTVPSSFSLKTNSMSNSSSSSVPFSTTSSSSTSSSSSSNNNGITSPAQALLRHSNTFSKGTHQSRLASLKLQSSTTTTTTPTPTTTTPPVTNITKNCNINKSDNNYNNNLKCFTLIIKFLNRIFLKFPKWLHLLLTCKRLTEKQYIRNKYFLNFKNYFKLSIDMCIQLNNQCLSVINDQLNNNSNNNNNNDANMNQINNINDPLAAVTVANSNTLNTNVKSNYSIVSCLTQNNNNNNSNCQNFVQNTKLEPSCTTSSSSSSSSSSSCTSSSSAATSSSSSFFSEIPIIKEQNESLKQQNIDVTISKEQQTQQQSQQQQQPKLSESSAYSTSTSTTSSITDNKQPSQTLKRASAAEILNAAHFASLKDIQIYILKRLDNDNELKLKFNKINAIEMLNLLLIKSNNCLLYVEKILDLILLNIINSREIRDIPVTVYGLYLFLIDRLIADLNSVSILFNKNNSEQNHICCDMCGGGGKESSIHHHTQHDHDCNHSTVSGGSQPSKKQLIYSIFNIFIVTLKPLNKLSIYLKLKFKYASLDYNYFEYIFNSIAPVLFKEITNNDGSTIEQQQRKYLIFHSSLIEWFSDIKFCTKKYLSNLNEGNFILALFYLNKIKKRNNNDYNHHRQSKIYYQDEHENDTKLNFNKHKKLLKLFKKFQYHLINSYSLFTNAEYNYVLTLCDSTSSLLANYQLINDFLLNNNKKFFILETDYTEPLVDSINVDNDDTNEVYANACYNASKTHDLIDIKNHVDYALNSNYSLAKYNMCDSGLDLNNEMNVNYQVLLFDFVMNGDLNGVRLLISKGVDLEMTDSLNQTALVFASKLNNYEIVDYLCRISSINLNHCDNDGWTALRYSSWTGNEKIVKRLLESQASVDACDSDGRTALRAAVYGNHEAIMKLLIKYGANVNKCDIEGRSILQIACYMGHWNIVNYLIKYDKLINHRDFYGRNALFTCLYTQNKVYRLDIMKLLINYGCYVYSCDNNNQTVLISAVQEQLIDVIQLLITHGADIDAIDNLGYTSIAYAIRNKNAKIVELLLNYNAAMHILDLEGRSILSIACSSKCEEAVKLLMIRGLDEMHKDNFGWTPLHEASNAGSDTIVEMLLNYGSDINDVDNEGKSGLYYACQEGHFDVVKVLISKNASLTQRSHEGNTPFR